MRGIAQVGSIGRTAGLGAVMVIIFGATVCATTDPKLKITNTVEESLHDSIEYLNKDQQRKLQASSTCTDDTALDPLMPVQRAGDALDIRETAALLEYTGSLDACQTSNGETSTLLRFHKTLPHNSLGEVDGLAFEALQECLLSRDFDICDAIPSGIPGGLLVNPLGGVAVDMTGPASTASTTEAPPTLESADLAAQLAELYWMALARDVPFSQYASNNVTVTAAANLAAMEGFPLASDVAIGTDGSVDPFSQLFRASFVGVETGPMVSQLLVNDFTIDSIRVSPRQTTFVSGVDYMTDYDEWLRIQDGGAPAGTEETDSVERYLRSARDLARLVFTDTINTEAYRGALILLERGAITRVGSNGPYESSTRQSGFVQHGNSHVMKLLGTAETAQRSSWYQKWNVHLFARPEAVGGVVHNVLSGALTGVNIHESLLTNMELLVRVAAANGAQNTADGVPGDTYLLSQGVKEGSPAHPSYPAGHAVQNGAFATVLKALVGLDRGEDCFPNPVVPDDDGLQLLPYSGECLTYEGEINKLAANVAMGRQMLGVHYRFDNSEGMILGEIIAVRILQQELMALPEDYSYEFRLYRGSVIVLNNDGTFAIDGVTCAGPVFTGTADC